MINYILEKFTEVRYISSLDLIDGYWQTPWETGSRQYTDVSYPM